MTATSARSSSSEGHRSARYLCRSVSSPASRRRAPNDFLTAIRATKPSLTPEVVADFEDDTQRFARD